MEIFPIIEIFEQRLAESPVEIRSRTCLSMYTGAKGQAVISSSFEMAIIPRFTTAFCVEILIQLKRSVETLLLKSFPVDWFELASHNDDTPTKQHQSVMQQSIQHL